MGRAFSKLRQSVSRETDTRRVLNWANRLHRLEVMLFEQNTYLVHLVNASVTTDAELTPQQKCLLQAAEEFRAHVKQVLGAMSNGD